MDARMKRELERENAGRWRRTETEVPCFWRDFMVGLYWMFGLAATG